MKSKLFGVSMITISCLYGLLAGIVILAVLLLGGNVLFAILSCLIILLIQFLIAPWLTDISMKFFYKTKFDKEIPEYLEKFINEECSKYNVKYPKIGIIDDGAPNAFTYGRTKKDARLVLTRGIFDILTEDEVKAVVGHEMGHIVHLDMLVMTAVQVVPLVLYAVYDLTVNGKSNKSDNSDNKAAIVGYIAFVLYIICQYFILWLSRTREYYADEFSVKETNDPSTLIKALVKIGFGLSTITNDSDNKKQDVSKRNALGIFDKSASKAMAISAGDGKVIDKMRIKNAMKWEMWNPWAKWYELNSTHPLISKRINRISQIAKEMNKDPYIVFDLEKTQKFAGNFALELLISLMPIICIIITGILCVIFNENIFKVCGIGLLLYTAFSFIKFNRAHKSGYKEATVEELLGNINVSHITSIPAIVNGTIIGKGDPGCIFSEDFVIKDKTGIIFLDYNQPLFIINKIFALFKSGKYVDEEITVKGWYRRSPVPYIEIYEYTINGKTKKVWTYDLGIGLHILLAIASIVLLLI